MVHYTEPKFTKMRIIQILIDKKTKNSEVYNRLQRKEFSYLEFIDAYMLALAYLDEYDPDMKRRIKLWKKLVSSPLEDKKKYLKKLLKLKSDQFNFIIKALNKMEEEKLKNPLAFGSIYKPFTFGCLEYEYESNR